MSSTPPPHKGLRHVALFVRDVDRSVAWYTGNFGMVEEWRPDPENAYLTGGVDNLALHRGEVTPGVNLDHMGFVVATPDDVDLWEGWLRDRGVEPEAPARTHRDGARSFYVKDPDGHRIQVLFHPPISDK